MSVTIPLGLCFTVVTRGALEDNVRSYRFPLLTIALASAQDISGEWNGTLNTAAQSLKFVLHLAKNGYGSLKATLDRAEQGVNGIPVRWATINNSHLYREVDAVHATYEGKINEDASELKGTWDQGASFEFNLRYEAAGEKPASRAGKPSDINGDWLGVLDTGMGRLRVVLHITNTKKGLTATVGSPDQNFEGLPVTITRNGFSLKFEMKTVGRAEELQIPEFSYDGTIQPDLGSINGTWSQLSRSIPLVLKRVKSTAELELHRPQNPVKPYPYREEEITYRNPKANVQLAATITIPAGTGPFPAVLLMAGSGPHDRDETVMGHKPFLVLADYLTRKGIVVSRADKRGVGRSGGDYAQVVMADFVADADAGIAYLKSRPEVDAKKIGLLGHSEGATEAPMTAVHNRDVAFVVMMAGTGVPFNQILPEQSRLMDQAAGKDAAVVDQNLALEREALALLEKDKDKDQAMVEKDLRETLAGEGPDALLTAQIKFLSSPWFRSFLDYDPAPTLTKLTCPVLVLNGSKDVQVPPQQNLPAIRKALEAGHNRDFEIDELPGLNHLFQNAKTGAPNEYGEIEETMSPLALEKVARWILKESAARSVQQQATR